MGGGPNIKLITKMLHSYFLALVGWIVMDYFDLLAMVGHHNKKGCVF